MEKPIITEKEKIYNALEKLEKWIEKNNYKSYDPFDGLNSYLRPLTFENKYLKIALQQSIRRFPINLRPLLGIKSYYSTKSMGFLAKGYLKLFLIDKNQKYLNKAKYCLDWLINNQSKGYSGACWGNHFDYQSRMSYIPKGMPTTVWTSLIGHSFLDAYEILDDKNYLDIAISACNHIVNDLERKKFNEGIYIAYHPSAPSESHQVHNANVLGASLLTRIAKYNNNDNFLSIAKESIKYTVNHIRDDYSWYYGEHESQDWVDNFHTGYVLDSIKIYMEYAGDTSVRDILKKAFEFYKRNFFLENGMPEYYHNRCYPIDIQCCSQSIETLLNFRDIDPSSMQLAQKVANWTIDNMQDESGYFYYRKYPFFTNKTPTMHWGESTMFSALAYLYLIMEKPYNAIFIRSNRRRINETTC